MSIHSKYFYKDIRDKYNIDDRILFKKHKAFTRIIHDARWNTLKKFDGIVHEPLTQDEMNKYIKCPTYYYPLINHMCLYSESRLHGIQ